MIISCSWDDSTYKDIDLIKILDEFNIQATFYLVNNTYKDYWGIYSKHEVGNHTKSHRNLEFCSENLLLKKY